jgi:hypothetical protein
MVRGENPGTDNAAVEGAMRSFDAVVSSWAEPVRCQSAYGCRRPASWLAIRHPPCGGHQTVCTRHYRKWLRAALARIARSGRMRCTVCGETFNSIEQCIGFRPL